MRLTAVAASLLINRASDLFNPKFMNIGVIKFAKMATYGEL